MTQLQIYTIQDYFVDCIEFEIKIPAQECRHAILTAVLSFDEIAIVYCSTVKGFSADINILCSLSGADNDGALWCAPYMVQ